MFGSHHGGLGGGHLEEERDIHINITPMIDVLISLLFFLLISFGAVIIALINATVPVQSEGSAEPQTGKVKITMGLSITKKEIVASASHDRLSEAELAKLKKTFPATKDGYDYKALNEYLYTVKRQYQESENVIITPDPEIDYDTLVQVMDASREKVTILNRRSYKVPLFPAAVVSTIVK
ncbi:MAG: biopolymer transporter ExbD [Deltaproteobacteria bacterium]|nr:biopolymer transporter ExbD [Deltaproteobacteria bacterium]